MESARVSSRVVDITIVVIQEHGGAIIVLV